MATIQFNAASFREQFPAFADTTVYPDATLQTNWTIGTNYVNDQYGGCYTGRLSLSQQTLALNLMTAHLVFLAGLIASGQTPGIETGATVDKISVTIEPPPVKDLWQYWLAVTPYGAQLLALLQGAAVGGFYFSRGAIPGRAGFAF